MANWQTTKNHPGVAFYASKKRTFKGHPDRCFYIRYDNGQGKRVQEKVGWASEGINPTIASRLRAERIRTALIEGEAIPTKKKRKASMTFNDFMEEKFLPWSRANKSSWVKEEQFHRLWLSPVIGEKALDEIAEFDLERVKANMRKAGKSPKTVNYCLDTVRLAFNKARDWKLFAGENPGKVVKRIRQDNRRTRFLSVDECRDVLEACRERSEQLYRIALLSLSTGMRAGECFALRWGDIDLDHDTINIKDPKNRTNRTAFMTPEIKAMFERMEPGNPDSLVFPARGGGKIQAISQAFRRVIADLKLNSNVSDRRDRVTFHTLRHTFASHLAIAGVPLHVIGSLLGHKSLAMTQRYSHLSAQARRNAVSLLPSFQEQNAKIANE